MYRGGPTSRNKVPSAANLPPHVEEDPIFILSPGGLGDTWVEFLTEALRRLVVRPSRKILRDLMPTMAMFSNSLQEQLVFLYGPSPLPEGRIEGMYPALSTSLVRSAVDKFGYLDPIDLFPGGYSAGND